MPGLYAAGATEGGLMTTIDQIEQEYAAFHARVEAVAAKWRGDAYAEQVLEDFRPLLVYLSEKCLHLDRVIDGHGAQLAAHAARLAALEAADREDNLPRCLRCGVLTSLFCETCDKEA
jgi:hypothetical protein